MFNSNEKIQPFNGSIDELLEKSMLLDPDEVEKQVERDNYVAVINEIQHMYGISFESAEEMYKEAHLEMIQKELDELVAEGKVKIVGTDENGDPLYSAV